MSRRRQSDHASSASEACGGDQRISSQRNLAAWSAALVSELLSMGSKSTRQTRGWVAREEASHDEPEPDSKRRTNGMAEEEVAVATAVVVATMLLPKVLSLRLLLLSLLPSLFLLLLLE